MPDARRSKVPDAREGTIPFEGYRTWYRFIGVPASRPSGKLPLLLVHGGPGGSHDSFEPLEALARTGRSCSTTR